MEHICIPAQSQVEAAEHFLAALKADGARTWTGAEGRRVSWRCWGQGAPVVFLHGASGSWRHWARQIEPLRDRARLIVPDLPGYGESDMPALPLDFQAMARDVAMGVDALVGDAETYDIVAFSFGGAVVSELLRLHPGRQNRIVLCAPAGFGQPKSPPMLKVRALQGDALWAAHRANLASIMIADPARIDALALCIQKANSQESRLRLAGMTRPANLADALTGFAGEATIVWGEQDAFLPDGGVEARIARIGALCPGARLVTFPDAGHWTAYEAAERLNALLTKTLRDS